MPAVRRLRPRVGPRIAARVPEGFDTRPYERFSVEPLAPTIGAVVGGVSLADPLDDELLAELNRALLEWKVLFFREQDITPEQHVALRAAASGSSRTIRSCRITSQPEAPPRCMRPREERRRQGGYENVWHSDVTWRARAVARLGAARRRGPGRRRRHALRPTWTPPTTASTTTCAERIDGPARRARLHAHLRARS